MYLVHTTKSRSRTRSRRKVKVESDAAGDELRSIKVEDEADAEFVYQYLARHDDEDNMTGILGPTDSQAKSDDWSGQQIQNVLPSSEPSHAHQPLLPSALLNCCQVPASLPQSHSSWSAHAASCGSESVATPPRLLVSGSEISPGPSPHASIAFPATLCDVPSGHLKRVFGEVGVDPGSDPQPLEKRSRGPRVPTAERRRRKKDREEEAMVEAMLGIV